MPELEQEAVIDITSPNSSLPVSPYILSPISSEVSISHGSETDIEYGGVNYDLYFLTHYIHFQLPLEPTLKEILIRATGSNELNSVRKLQLQVAAFETSLQHIPVHIPFLTELTLDGSVIMSLRDLGTGLKHLKILSVARCGLTNLDGMFCLDTLEEFYAQDNRIKDLSPCGFLLDVRVLNLKGNVLADILTVSFLSVCNYLEHLVLDGNGNMSELSRYRRIVKSILPNLKTLDGEDITSEEIILEYTRYSDLFNENPQSESTVINQEIDSNDNLLEDAKAQKAPVKIRNTMPDEIGQFVVSFPPKILSPRPTSGSSSDTSINSCEYSYSKKK